MYSQKRSHFAEAFDVLSFVGSGKFEAQGRGYPIRIVTRGHHRQIVQPLVSFFGVVFVEQRIQFCRPPGTRRSAINTRFLKRKDTGVFVVRGLTIGLLADPKVRQCQKLEYFMTVLTQKVFRSLPPLL